MNSTDITPSAVVTSSSNPSTSFIKMDESANGASSAQQSNDKEQIINLDTFQPKFNLRQKQELTLQWDNLNLKVGKKQILTNISGAAKPREVMAIMGPSGAGKSTLLNVLAGRVVNSSGKKLTGKVMVNGKVIRPISFRKRVAYVLQADALFATATAREALEFSAMLRLPRSFTSSERKELVNNLLDTLGLMHVQHTLVGSDLIRGLSGGEKKRVAVGVELVTNPSILFLDEPTSGLDSYSALLLMKILHAIADSGCAIMCTIHQPSSEIFLSFDTLYLLAKGQTIYAGRGGDGVNEAFAAVGLPVPANTNPADHIMFMAQTRPIDQLPHVQLLTEGVNKTGDNSSDDDEKLVFEATAGVCTQTMLLAKREFQGTYRNKAGLIGRFGGTLFLNLLISLIFLGTCNPEKEDYTVQTHFGAITQIFIGALFGASQPILLTFPLDRITFVREYATGTYGAFAYFVSKLVLELPLSFLTALVIYAVAYPLMELQGNFILLVITTWLLMIASASTALLVGALVSDPKAAQEVAPIIFVPQLLFTGFFVRISQIPEWLRWVQYLCSAKYGLNLGVIVEFTNCTASCEPKDCKQKDFIDQAICEELYEFNEVDRDLWWVYALILLAIFFGFRTLSLLILTIKAKNFSS